MWNDTPPAPLEGEAEGDCVEGFDLKLICVFFLNKMYFENTPPAPLESGAEKH